ncbi:hypothetical protein [Clostridium grantii]|uniref:ABC-2 type transport system permease protein n=1 Tax=Clostridium grantii DSM 8605 TaxID=1121316 RepID=A0A1M5XWK0_9CLOT|nr:hypothetical protein [Clostridium grantii]SHI04069.1 hypothetical protein SAMN02745207_03986 [Clostridium grantii DSM 8605]
MINTFLATFKVNFAIGGNTLIHFLKRLPLIGKKIPDKLYNETEIKIVLGVIEEMLKIFLAFLGKAFYLGIMILFPSFLMNNFTFNSNGILPKFLHIFFFLSFFIGPLTMTVIFDKSNRDAYNMIVLMRADAKKFYLSQLIYKRITDFIYFLLPLIIIGNFIKLSILEALMLMVELTIVKFIGECILLFIYDKTGKRLNDNEKIQGIIIIVGLVLAYALPVFNLTINFASILLNIVTMVILILLGAISLIYLFRYRKYKAMSREFLAREKAFEVEKILKDAKFADVKVDEAKMIKGNITKDIYKDKKGYEYLNAIFFLRYKKIISKPIKIRVALIAITFIAFVAVIILEPSTGTDISNAIKVSVNIWVFVMYLMSTTQRVCKAIFHNCDVSLLRNTYYRQGNAILSNFTIRLKKIVILNLIPALAICISLILIMIISRESGLIIGSIPVFICILCLSCFFSIHHLFLYYVVQPYTKELEVKSPLFSIVNGVMYLICYGSLQIKTSSLYFSYGIIVATILYMMFALILTYKLAPKTFRLK